MKYLGVDFGLRKIGLAISEGMIATPFKVIHVNSQQDATRKILEIAKRENINKIIVGVPESGVRDTILKVVKKLRADFEVEEVEEHLSSKNAKSTMINLGIAKKKREEEDAYSAAIILQDYLDNKI